ncbi:MAG: orotidine-5'-phosphate decarboxylase [Candidatus Gribaldobacteria bacterium]|nr:orotidine-5'-phosphate decarboxylase [Candidatus Gribaldobacteria bacterium]
MAERNFMEMLKQKWQEGKFVCVGLDSDYDKIPQSIKDFYNEPYGIMGFNEEIVDATKDIVCAYKPNIAFYEAQGPDGIDALWDTISDIIQKAPDVPIILDAKRADIGNTNMGYIESAFDYLRADAITINPYFGMEAVQPFLDMANKGIFVLCRTSNPGAGEFQDKLVQYKKGNTDILSPLYQFVADNVCLSWNKNKNCGLVVGATQPYEMKTVRDLVGDMPILVPGVGAQGGDVEKIVRAGLNGLGTGIIVNSSRGIIFASNGEDFAEVARQKTLELHNEITRVISEMEKEG